METYDAKPNVSFLVKVTLILNPSLFCVTTTGLSCMITKGSATSRVSLFIVSKSSVDSTWFKITDFATSFITVLMTFVLNFCVY